MNRRPTFLTYAALGAACLGAHTARAGLTDVKPAAAGEAGHEQILENLYGIDFSRSGSDWVAAAGGMTVRRVDDDADRRFDFDAPRRLDLVAAFTGYRWDFGLQSGGGDVLASASQSGSGFDASGGLDVPAGSEGVELFLRHRNGTRYASGDASDQLVTYEVSGGGDSAGDLLFFWEDWARGGGSDMDFNDLVLRSSGLPGAAAVEAPQAAASVPLPPAAWPGVGGIVGVVALSLRRRFRRRGA